MCHNGPPDKFITFVSLLGQHIRSLVALDKSFDSLDAALFLVILASIPSRFRNKYNESSRARSLEADGQLESLLDFLEFEADLLEIREEQAQYSLNLSTRPKQEKKKIFEKQNKSRDDRHQPRDSEQPNRRSQYSFAAGTYPVNHSCT